MTDFKFPHTPHLAWLGTAAPRTDKVLSPSEVAAFLDGPITVEEKVDGANIGIGFSEEGDLVVKNRGTVLSTASHPQFRTLWTWLSARETVLWDQLGPDLMLFGEWCYAVHSVRYRSLPDYFLAFDVYDHRARKFWSVARRNELARRAGIVTAPSLKQGTFSLSGLKALLQDQGSRFGPEKAEGLYLRKDEGRWLLARAKLVRPEFVQAIGDHWTKRSLERNLLNPLVPSA
jgi:ATP-dependent RNA circularization protein (DNA/RNA ligase family)